ncbi:CHAP domain-containing protein [Dokdonia pacifica]|uniref:CHAP domain-containing protein n=1 Tax=Dokdonia pacifica TaxID=1627892 RepID=A0A238YX87_9FLAO|nr:CHAP domain-containing protein [Dokdonia pacifica]SNR75348.1 CHAP domain-containing protein [Dokdonia pacifica]
MKKLFLRIFGILIVLAGGIFIFKNSHLNVTYEIGQEIDSFNNIPVYYNGNVGNIDGRQLTNDGYNLGLKYQCVEFVKRYYYEHLNHKMPDSYGHAKDFFNPSVKDGKINKQRNLLQYTNLSVSKPKVNDLVIYSGNIFNKFGHVAIVTKVLENEIEIIQQNPGPYNNSRETYKLIYSNNKWYIDNHRIIGWLRK